MFKKFFIALILGLMVMSSHIAAANVDWSKVPVINSKAELARYIENGRRKGQTTFYFTFPSVKIHNEQERRDFQFEIAQSNFIRRISLKEEGGFGTGQFICTIYQEYPGTRVANAYLSGDISKLTPDELELYRKALPIVNEAKKRSSSLEKELYIHDAICKKVNYRTPQTNPSAYAALVNGETNCQGYSDAFYMLGRMAGLNVRRVGGKFNGEFHIWNTITFDDGKTYCVDVTQDDSNYSGKNRYIFFNAPLEVVQSTHQYPWEAMANLQRNIDNRYAYRSLTNHAQVSSAEEGLNLIAQKIGKENFSRFSVMAPYDEKFSEANKQQNANYVTRATGKVIVLDTVQFGKYLFFTGVLP